MPKKNDDRPTRPPKEDPDESRCFDCDQICCRTAVIEVDPPKSLRDHSDFLFYLYHFDTRIAIAGNPGREQWFVEFMSPCRHLVDGRCAIYERRPIVCREYDSRTCERSRPERFEYISTPEEYMGYIEKRAPARLIAKLKDSHLPPGARPPAKPASSAGGREETVGASVGDSRG
jgi:Fe-S-cluster containining protein